MKNTHEIASELRYCADLVDDPRAHPEVIGQRDRRLDNVNEYLRIQMLTLARSFEFHAAGVLAWAAADWAANPSAVSRELRRAAADIISEEETS